MAGFAIGIVGTGLITRKLTIVQYYHGDQTVNISS